MFSMQIKIPPVYYSVNKTFKSWRCWKLLKSLYLLQWPPGMSPREALLGILLLSQLQWVAGISPHESLVNIP